MKLNHYTPEVMPEIRRLLAAAFLLSALVALTGCPERQPVISNLPEPFVHPFPVRPAPGPFVQPPPAPSPTPVGGPVRGTVVLDPGHGGKDPGTWPRGTSRYPEKVLVLDMAKRAGQILAARGARVVMTRSSDVFLSLEQRALIADRSGADLFVSFHVDAAPRNQTASGVEAHIYNQATSASIRAAQCIIAAIRQAGIETRGIQYSNLHVLREHSRPAVLMECGFLTNAQDAAALNNGTYRARLATAIAEGIANYLAK